MAAMMRCVVVPIHRAICGFQQEPEIRIPCMAARSGGPTQAAYPAQGKTDGRERQRRPISYPG